MGGEKTVTQETQTTPTEQEKELLDLELERQKATQQGMIDVQTTGLNLVNQLLSGEELPGYLQELSEGISPDVTQSIVNQSLEDITPQFQSSGILDSGVAAEISARTAADIRTAAEEYNLGNTLSLLNLALSGSTSVQQPVLSSAQTLSSSLAGLRSTSSTQTSSGGTNPFLTAGLTAAGTAVGGPLGGAVASGIGSFFKKKQN